MEKKQKCKRRVVGDDIGSNIRELRFRGREGYAATIKYTDCRENGGSVER